MPKDNGSLPPVAEVIDLRSDTVTLPTDEMRRAMAEAAVGDDVYGEDPTVNALEARAAALMGTEAALFTASGTMSNLLAVLTHTRPGDEVILGAGSHIFLNEVGGAAALGGVMVHTVPDGPDGAMALEDIKAAIRPENIHFPRTTLLCLENTHNRCGGVVLSPQYTAAAVELAHRYGLAVHIDGARVFNAAVALGVPARELVKGADSVSFCLSKGLSAPVGSLLCGSGDFVRRARRWRKMVGGGMRQAGIIAAAGIVALDTMLERLTDDHENARRLAEGLAGVPGIVVRGSPPTNIVLFESELPVPGAGLRQAMEARGVRVGFLGGRDFRAVTHRMISAADVDLAVRRIAAAVVAP